MMDTPFMMLQNIHFSILFNQKYCSAKHGMRFSPNFKYDRLIKHKLYLISIAAGPKKQAGNQN